MPQQLSYSLSLTYVDLLLWVMVIVGMLGALWALRREYWRNAYAQITQSNTAVISFAIISLLLAIALTDSITLQPYRQLTKQSISDISKNNATHTFKVGDKQKFGSSITLLDRLLKAVILPEEKTYSSPFATRSLSMIDDKNDQGVKIRIYPPLKYVCRQLREEQSVIQKKAIENTQIPDDVASTYLSKKILFGLGYSLLIAPLSIGLVYWLWVILGIGRLKKQGQKSSRPAKNKIVCVLSFVAITSITLVTILYLSQFNHVLGTDKTGGSVLGAAVKSIRTGIVIGTLTTFIIAPISIIMGVSAGYFKGWVDDAVQYLYTTLSSIPSILLIIASMFIVNILQPKDYTTAQVADFKLFWLCVVLAITSWANICRLVRAETLKLREIEYIQAATALGQNHFMIIIKHIIPNVMHIVLITIVLRFSGLVLSEAVLAYIGVGLDPSMNSWGNMIVQAQSELSRDPLVWWNFLTALFFMILLVLPANLLGDAIRDALDPRLRTQSD